MDLMTCKALQLMLAGDRATVGTPGAARPGAPIMVPFLPDCWSVPLAMASEGWSESVALPFASALMGTLPAQTLDKLGCRIQSVAPCSGSLLWLCPLPPRTPPRSPLCVQHANAWPLLGSSMNPAAVCTRQPRD